MCYIKIQQKKIKIFKIFIGTESISKIVYTESRSSLVGRDLQIPSF